MWINIEIINNCDWKSKWKSVGTLDELNLREQGDHDLET